MIFRRDNMAIKQFFKPNIIIPLLVSIIFGAVLFFRGETDDSPGLSLIAVILCIGLLYFGIHNANKMNQNVKPSIVLPLLMGLVGIICVSQYLIAGIYDEPPGLILIGIILSLTLLSVGLINIKKAKKKTVET
jgi:peptidoglycan biosynthesis protein MviN/MurJ (putative lipid II flippase)